MYKLLMGGFTNDSGRGGVSGKLYVMWSVETEVNIMVMVRSGDYSCPVGHPT